MIPKSGYHTYYCMFCFFNGMIMFISTRRKIGKINAPMVVGVVEADLRACVKFARRALAILA